jgi:hypothetical protein
MTKSISLTKRIFVEKNSRRESLIQSKEIDEEKHVVFSYHIEILKDLMY